MLSQKLHIHPDTNLHNIHTHSYIFCRCNAYTRIEEKKKREKLKNNNVEKTRKKKKERKVEKKEEKEVV
jgi:hypothetical protein